LKLCCSSSNGGNGGRDVDGGVFAIEIEAKVNTAIKIILTKDDDDSDAE